ncbi:MAG TPA: haloacid dehalogenase-like hydrolase, partial [Sulfurovum sp.]|nr:haloacid dehalogenase-like hydrolase [Sulfurovum sp.]
MYKRLLILSLFLTLSLQATDVLPSWNDSAPKKNIISYVTAVTDEKSADFIPKIDRIAVFDNDGTLWSEQPVYFQLFFAIDRVKALAPKHPEWKTTQPFKAVLEGDMKALVASGKEGLLKLIMATHAGMNDEEFDA